MRRAVPVVAIGLGAFLLVGGFVIRFYVYPKVAVAPIDQNSVSTLVAEDATVFDVASLSEITTDLTTVAKTTADVEASEEAGDNIRVWVNTSSTRDSDGVIRGRQVDRAAFDATSGEAVNCCDEYLSTEENELTPVKHEGLLFKLPFNTQKKSYMWWDETLLKAVPIEYQAEEELDGLKVYRFEGDIPRTNAMALDEETGELVPAEREVPASLLQLDGVEGNVTAQDMYSNHRTFWVEPNTGVVIKRLEEQKSTIAYDGEDKVTTTEVATEFTDETVQANIDEYGTLGMLLGLARGPIPWIFGIIGALLVGLGLVLSRREQPRGRRAVSPQVATTH
jgi:hypothetical protein